jgi:unsaturated chondroitin disaccharide hydrolase
MKLDGREYQPADFSGRLEKLFEAASVKSLALGRRWKPADGSPVFTASGRYTSRGWTEWTQGFQFGAALYCFEATGRSDLLEYARAGVRGRMAVHLSHTGVHDHGFNNVSTYANLLRLMRLGLIERNAWEADYYRLAL